jgi:hypothetical protein
VVAFARWIALTHLATSDSNANDAARVSKGGPPTLNSVALADFVPEIASIHYKIFPWKKSSSSSWGLPR